MLSVEGVGTVGDEVRGVVSRAGGSRGLLDSRVSRLRPGSRSVLRVRGTPRSFSRLFARPPVLRLSFSRRPARRRLGSISVRRFRSSSDFRGVSLSSPIGICLHRVKHIPLLSNSRRVRLTIGVDRNDRCTGRHLARTGLHLIMDVTGGCIKHNVCFLSLVRRNGINLVGTIRGFSRAGNFGFSACTA